LEHMRVGGIMALHPRTITLDTSLREAAQLFATTKRQGLPVVEDGVLIGLLTEDRVMQACALLLEEAEQSTELNRDA
jgi:predicted transcriptional regulator